MRTSRKTAIIVQRTQQIKLYFDFALLRGFVSKLKGLYFISEVQPLIVIS